MTVFFLEDQVPQYHRGMEDLLELLLHDEPSPKEVDRRARDVQRQLRNRRVKGLRNESSVLRTTEPADVITDVEGR